MSNALESASLIMYPSGYSDGTLGSVKPTDGSGDFTFTRGAGDTCTRVGPNGYIEKGYENLLTYSNVFNQGYPHWATSGVNIPTGNQIGYDGSSDAWLLERNATNGFLYAVTSQSGVNTFSVYAKANTADFVALREVNGYGMVYFDLSNGTIGTSTGGNVFAKSIDSVGNGWYRCSIHISGSSLSQVRIHPTTQNGSTSGTSGSIYIQDAMLNQGLVAYPYIETTTAPVAGGILEDEPRIDFSDGCGHLLLEPSRTNLFPNSEFINSSGGWLINGSTASLSNVTSPDGLSKMTEVVFDVGGATSYIRDDFGFNGGSITQSIFVKKDENGDSFARLTIGGIDNIVQCWFNLDTGELASSTGNPTNTSIEDYGNGIYRISATSSSTIDTSGAFIFSSAASAGGYATTGSKMYFWGAQLEEATYPTSYIPTYGVSQTRLRDSAAASNVASLIGQTEGTILIECDVTDIEGYDFFGLSDGIGGNRIILGISDSATQGYRLIVTSNSTTSIDIRFGNTTAGGFVKIAVRYNSGAYEVYVNGLELLSTTGVSSFSETLNQFMFDAIGGAIPLLVPVKQYLYFPTALSDSECIELTTI